MIDRRSVIAMGLGGLAFAPLPGMVVAQAGHLNPTGFLRSNWSKDPFARGSYSYLPRGVPQAQRAVLSRPVGGRLFFAGEAIHPHYNSTVHAAFESGQAAARAVARTSARTVAVIGAGVSGLAAAQHLAEQGRQVTVFEARNRLGGRVVTDRTLGVPLDIGASWVHGIRGNPLSGIADDLGLVRRSTGASYVALGRGGRELAEHEVPDWIEAETGIQTAFGADAAALNPAVFESDLDYDGGDVAFPGGYDQILAGLTGRYALRLSTVVSRLALPTGGGIEVASDQGLVAQADACVVTLPLGVLQSGQVAFDPPLPESHQQVINSLGMGLLDKLYLRFASAFWHRDVHWISIVETGLPRGQFNEWLNLYPFLKQPVLLALNGGSAAAALSGLSDRQIVDRALGVLGAAYPA